MKRLIFVVVALLAGCVQMPPTAQDIQAKKFEAVSGKAVIYVVQPLGDSSNSGTVNLGDAGSITTQPGTYYRWEVAPGTHRIEGAGPFSAAAVVQAEAGKIYFVQHSVHGGIREGVSTVSLQQVGDAYGRRLVSLAQLI